MIAGNISVKILPRHKKRKKSLNLRTDYVTIYFNKFNLIIKLIANENFLIIETPTLQKVNCSIVSVQILAKAVITILLFRNVW